MKLLPFDTPVDASHYIAGGNTAATGIALRAIDYEQNTYIFQVQNPDGSLASQVNSIQVALADESTAAADVRAAIAATVPA